MASPLISAAELKQADTEQGLRDYCEAHIPNSHYLHLDKDLSGPTGSHGGRHPLPSAQQFQQTMRRYGVNADTLVVAYDDQRFAFASRLWWLLRFFGHDKVCVLDGGFGGWCADDGAVENAAYKPSEDGDFVAMPNTVPIVDYDNICQHLENPDRLLIDSREAPRYQGLEEPIDPIAGHIPGAANYPWQEVTDSHGFTLSPANWRQRWATLPGDRELVVYCGSGVTACVNLLSLELAGIHGAKLYAGSWSDWCSYQ